MNRNSDVEELKYHGLRSCLEKYLRTIKSFQTALQSLHSFSEVPYNVAGREFSKAGSIEIDGIVFEYNYHGAGCSITQNGQIQLNYDIAPTVNEQVKISVWKFWKYVSTNNLQFENDEVVTELDVKSFFAYMESIGQLRKQEGLRGKWVKVEGVEN